MNITFYDSAGNQVGTVAKESNYALLRFDRDAIQRKTASGWKPVERIEAEHKTAQESLVLDFDGSADELQPHVEVVKYTHAGAAPDGVDTWAPTGSGSWRKLSKFVTRLDFKGPEHGGHSALWDFTGAEDPPLRLKVVLKRKI